MQQKNSTMESSVYSYSLCIALPLILFFAGGFLRLGLKKANSENHKRQRK